MSIAFGLVILVGPAFGSDALEPRLGLRSHELVQGFCQSPEIVIATVERVESFVEPTSQPGRPLVASHAYLRVSHTLRDAGEGRDGTLLHVPMLGGKTEKHETGTPFGRMLPIEGTRYVFGFTPFPSDSGYSEKGDPLVWAFIRMDPGKTPEALDAYGKEFTAFVKEHCAGQR